MDPRASARETKRINRIKRPQEELLVKMVQLMEPRRKGKKPKLRHRSRFKRPLQSVRPSTQNSSKKCTKRSSIVSVRTW